MAMSIKDHIEAGHYPKDDLGFPLVPSEAGKAHVVSTTGPRSDYLIVGFRDGGGACGWNADGLAFGKMLDSSQLLPPPPRKVKVTRWLLVDSAGRLARTTFENEGEAKNLANSTGCRAVELTGEYEEPWS